MPDCSCMLLSAVKAFGWILDGFPRTVEQARMLDVFLGGRGIDLVLNLHASLQEVEMRLCGRLVHLASGRSYHNVFNPPKVPEKDDVTGEPLTQREDDKPVPNSDTHCTLISL